MEGSRKACGLPGVFSPSVMNGLCALPVLSQRLAVNKLRTFLSVIYIFGSHKFYSIHYLKIINSGFLSIPYRRVNICYYGLVIFKLCSSIILSRDDNYCVLPKT